MKKVVTVSEAPKRIYLKLVREDKIEQIAEEEIPENADLDIYCALDVPEGYFDDPIHRNTMLIKQLKDGICSLVSHDEFFMYGDILWYRKFVKANRQPDGSLPFTGIEKELPSILIDSTIGLENTLPCEFDRYGKESYLEPPMTCLNSAFLNNLLLMIIS